MPSKPVTAGVLLAALLLAAASRAAAQDPAATPPASPPVAERKMTTPALRLGGGGVSPPSAIGSPLAQGNLAGSDLAALTTYALLHGVIQQEIGAARPTHVPLALRPSPFPRDEFERAREFHVRELSIPERGRAEEETRRRRARF